jgi:hypothetical protein
MYNVRRHEYGQAALRGAADIYLRTALLVRCRMKSSLAPLPVTEAGT